MEQMPGCRLVTKPNPGRRERVEGPTRTVHERLVAANVLGENVVLRILVRSRHRPVVGYLRNEVPPIGKLAVI